MNLVPAPRQRLSQIADQRPRNNGWHRGADNNPSLGAANSGLLKVDPADQTDHVVPQLKMDAFNEVTINNLGFGQWRGRDRFGHRSSPYEVAA